MALAIFFFEHVDVCTDDRALLFVSGGIIIILNIFIIEKTGKETCGYMVVFFKHSGIVFIIFPDIALFHQIVILLYISKNVVNLNFRNIFGHFLFFIFIFFFFFFNLAICI